MAPQHLATEWRGDSLLLTWQVQLHLGAFRCTANSLTTRVLSRGISGLWKGYGRLEASVFVAREIFCTP
jgi:hypothetical protein